MKLKMLKIILVVFSMASINTYSQELKYNDLSADKRPKGKYISYLSKDGAVYKIGDRITIGVPSSNKTFAYITQGDGMILPVTQLFASASGQSVEIKRIDVGGSRRTGFYASMRCKGLTALSNYSIQLENAISTGEVKSFGMTSGEALSELKNAKEKLDLELITKEEYEKVKAELIKYIK